MEFSGGTPGTYSIDALNAAASDPPSEAALIRFGFGGDDPITIWSAVPGFGDGLITGDPLTLTVLGETGIPAVSEWGMVITALLVLTAGTLAHARRRLARA